MLVYSSKKNVYSQTDSSGVVSLQGFPKGQSIVLQHPGYYIQELSFEELENLSFLVTLVEKVSQVEEVVISANKWETSENEVPFQIKSINSNEITFDSPQTSADLLTSTGQVFIQKSQMGGGSPKMRGFSANSVLLLIDGNRMNNAIYRSGNLHNVISIDPKVLERVEVIFGPASVMYGSDAMGGTMNFITQSLSYTQTSKKEFHASASSRYSTANQEKTGSLSFSIGSKNLATFTSLSYSDFGDLRTGSIRLKSEPDFGKRPEYVISVGGRDEIRVNPNENIQVGSAYNQFNFMQKFGFRFSKFWDAELSFYYTTTSDIPRYDRLTEYKDDQLKFAEWYYGPQKWLMNSLKLNYYRSNKIFDAVKVSLARQTVEESRYSRKLNDEKRRSQIEHVGIWSVNVDFDKQLSQQTRLNYGLEGIYNRVESDASYLNIKSGEISFAHSRYPNGGSDYGSYSAYSAFKWLILPGLNLNAGARISRIMLNSVDNGDFSEGQTHSYDQDNYAVTGSLGMTYQANKSRRFNFALSSGFRSPNVDDVGKLFSPGGDVITVPNQDLGPEYSYNAEIGINQKLGNFFEFDWVTYYSYLINAMVRRDFAYQGRDVLVLEGDTLRTQALVNAGKAYVLGSSLSIKSQLNEFFSLKSTLNWTRGMDLKSREPLRHVTPLFGQTAIRWEKKRIRGEFLVVYNGKLAWEDIAPEEKEKPHLYAPSGSPAWYTLNLKASFQFNSIFQINLALDNLLDHHYRPYSSGISAPGRNFKITLRAEV
ncbi:TonB-dependent receptor domain-containing protein [Xanthovirga aplysinae]|uniref:TonB-dependent receptor domain-containing protein n=1 Tax=Xanthovirga aplysinae TaxID=2529853 RepID=UPI001657213C